MKTVYLLLPYLLNEANYPLGPALSMLLQRASYRQAFGYESRLKALFNLKDLAVGALTLLTKQSVAPEHHYCRLDPASCLITHNSIYVASNQLGLTSAEVIELIEDLNHLLTKFHLRLMAIAPDAWVVRIPEDWVLNLPTLVTSLGKPLFYDWPKNPQAILWQALLTECQMRLQQHPINQVRLAKQQPLIQTLLPWGFGQLTPTTVTPMTVYSNALPVIGLAKQGNLTHYPMPAFFKTNLLQDDFILLVDEQFLFTPQTLLAAYEENWFKPLLLALQANQYQQLIIDTGWQQFSLNARALYYIWRRRNLADVINYDTHLSRH